MLVGLEARAPDARQDLAEGDVAVDRGPQRQRVQEQPDDVPRLRVRPIGDRRPDDDVGLSGAAVHEQLEHREHQHEAADVLGPRQPVEAGDQLARQLARHRRSGVALRGRAGAIGGQLRDGQWAGKPLAPVIQRPAPGFALEVQALEVGVVRVLDLERRQAVRPPVAVGAVQPAELAEEDLDRPGVAGDVVQVQGEHVLAGPEDEQPGAEQRAASQVERVAGVRGEPGAQLRLAVAGWNAGEVVANECQPAVGGNPLHRTAVFGAERGAERLVAGHQRPQRLLERLVVERALEPERRGNRIRRMARIECVKQPDAALREGGRKGDGRLEHPGTVYST